MIFYVRHNVEGFTPNKQSPKCPNLLIEKDSHFYLYNSTSPKVPGLNPIEFDSLEDYVKFLDWQKSKGIRCPVLYLQHTYDIQGNSSYTVRPSIRDIQGGIPHSPPTYASEPEESDKSKESDKYDKSKESDKSGKSKESDKSDKSDKSGKSGKSDKSKESGKSDNILTKLFGGSKSYQHSQEGKKK